MAQVRVRPEEADGDLPMVCMCCGAPATVTKTRDMSYVPQWVAVFSVIPILYVLMATIMTRKARVQAPLCDEHQGHWLKRTLWMWGLFLLFGAISGGGFLIAMSLQDGGRPNDSLAGISCGGGVVLFLVWLIVVIVLQNTAIRPEEIDYEYITIKGVSQEFVDAVLDRGDAVRAGGRGAISMTTTTIAPANGATTMTTMTGRARRVRRERIPTRSKRTARANPARATRTPMASRKTKIAEIKLNS